VILQHAALAGLSQGTAEEYYILAAQQLDGYGQETFEAKVCIITIVFTHYERLIYSVETNNTGQQNLTFFLAHEEKYLIIIELLTLNSNV